MWRPSYESITSPAQIATLDITPEQEPFDGPHRILYWLDLAGHHAAVVSAHLIRDLHLSQVQIDELWTFVKKQKHCLPDDPDDVGDMWVWRALALPHRLRVTSYLFRTTMADEMPRYEYMEPCQSS